MARLLAMLASAVVALAGCGEGETGAARDTGRSEVRITVDPDGGGPDEASTRTVECGTTGRLRECEFLAGVPLDAFDPVPPGTACTQVFGGPQTARVTGSLRGERVDAAFARSNGCEISRWERIAALLGRG